MAQRILILGATGMLGHRLVGRLLRDAEVVATVRGPAGPLRDHPAFRGARLVGGVSAERPETAAMAIDLAEPDAVVNCIGLVKQRSEAKDPIPALGVNGLFPHHAARAAREAGARFVHLSTDCVFSGRLGRPYREDDTPDAEDVYGRSKLVGEAQEDGALTLRTSIIGWELGARPSGLLEWAASQAGRQVRGFRHALFTGFTTDALSDLIAFVLRERPGLSGLWHAAAEPIDKLDLLTRLDRALGLGLAIEAADEPRIDRRLDGSRLAAETGRAPPDWDRMIADLARAPRHPRLGEG